MPLGRHRTTPSFFDAKRIFRGLGYFFAFVATVANASDAFNIAQAIVLPFFFTGIDLGIGLISFSVILTVAVSLLYIYQEGKSVVKGTEELPNKFSQLLAWFRGESKSKRQAPSAKALTTKQKWAFFAVEFITVSISFVVSALWAGSVIAGMVALAGAMGFAPTAPLVLVVAALAGVAQFSASFFQEGSNFMQTVRKDLKRWFGLVDVSPSKRTKFRRVKLFETYKIKPPKIKERRSPADQLSYSSAVRESSVLSTPKRLKPSAEKAASNNDSPNTVMTTASSVSVSPG